MFNDMGLDLLLIIILRTFSVSHLLQELQLPRLELRRQYNCAVLMYMIVNGLINVPIHSSLLILVSVNTRGHFHRFCQNSVFLTFIFPSCNQNLEFSSIITYWLWNCRTFQTYAAHTHVSLIANYRCIYTLLVVCTLNKIKLSARGVQQVTLPIVTSQLNL